MQIQISSFVLKKGGENASNLVLKNGEMKREAMNIHF